MGMNDDNRITVKEMQDAITKYGNATGRIQDATAELCSLLDKIATRVPGTNGSNSVSAMSQSMRSARNSISRLNSEVTAVFDEHAKMCEAESK